MGAHRSRIYQRGKKGTFWYYGVWNGREYRESLRTIVKTVAEREQRERDNRYGDPAYAPAVKHDLTVEAFWKVDSADNKSAAHDTGLYVDWLRSHRANATLHIHRRFWRALLAHTNAKRLSGIKRADIESFKRAASENRIPGQAKAWNDQTINNALRDIQAMYNRAIREEWYTGGNPADSIERFTLVDRLPEPHSHDDLVRLLESARNVGQLTEWTVLLGAWAGLRKMEILGARWEWFRFDAKEPTIAIKRYPGFEIKDRAEREIALAKRIRDAMQPHGSESGFVFNSGRPTQGKHKYPYDGRRGLVSALQRAGLTTKEPYQKLRVTFASIHADLGTDIFRVSRWLGHSSVKVTERYYARARGYHKDIDKY